MNAWLIGGALYLIAVTSVAGYGGIPDVADADSFRDQPVVDGFCALESAQECAVQLDVRWRQTSSTKALERLPIASLGDIKAAMESLGLHTLGVELTSGNILYVQRNISSGVRAIGWLPPGTATNDSDLEIGHFAVLNDVRYNGEIAFVDAASANVYLRNLKDDPRIPILLISSTSLEISSTAMSLDVIRLMLGSVWLIGAFGVVLACLWIDATDFSRLRKGGLCLSLGGAFVITFFISRVKVAEVKKTSPVPVGSDALIFAQHKYDFGQLIKENHKPQLASLLNTSEQAIVLKGIRASCGCITATPQHTTIPAHGKVDIDISFSTFLDGPNKYDLQAFGSDGQNAECVIVFEGNSSLNVSPTKHFFGSLSYASDLNNLQRLQVELVHFHDKQISGVAIGKIEVEQPFDVSILNVSGDHGEIVLLEFRLNSKAHFRGFVFQQVPLVVDLGEDESTTSISAGADFVE